MINVGSARKVSDGDEMNHSPLISSIIIFFNGAKYLQEAIESVFAQTDNWELFIGGRDGSTDGSTEIAMTYAAKRHPGKVRYLQHPHQNRGNVGASRNLGVRHGRGQYIALLDSDDVRYRHVRTAKRRFSMRIRRLAWSGRA